MAFDPYTTEGIGAYLTDTRPLKEQLTELIIQFLNGELESRGEYLYSNTPGIITAAAMTKGPTLEWEVLNQEGTVIYTHDGSNGYWYARFLLIPSNNTAIFIASNVGEGSNILVNFITIQGEILNWLANLP